MPCTRRSRSSGTWRTWASPVPTIRSFDLPAARRTVEAGPNGRLIQRLRCWATERGRVPRRHGGPRRRYRWASTSRDRGSSPPGTVAVPSRGALPQEGGCSGRTVSVPPPLQISASPANGEAFFRPPRSASHVCGTDHRRESSRCRTERHESERWPLPTAVRAAGLASRARKNAPDASAAWRGLAPPYAQVLKRRQPVEGVLGNRRDLVAVQIPACV